MTLEIENLPSPAQISDKLELEFDAIEKKNLWPYLFHQIKNESMKNDFSTDEAKKMINRNLNRYRDVNPYDHSRVILSKDEFNYINASYISVEEARRKYILTQGPLPNTIVHFWLMIWEQNSKAIIMLNKLIEKNQLKCSQYWPSRGNDAHQHILENSNSDGNSLELPEVALRIELLSEKKYADYVVRDLRLTNTETQQSRDILQFHYVTWPDFGVPPSPLAFLKFLRDIRQSGALDSSYGPPVVHCSAGIGRSGTFCLVDSCLILLDEKGVENVNIMEILLKMRTCRMGLIQTHDQLRFSYVALLQGLKVDWKAFHEDGLPAENYATNEKERSNGDSEEDAPPPLPPPRIIPPDKPLPGSPSQSSLSSNSSAADDVADDTASEIDSANESSVDSEDDNSDNDNEAVGHKVGNNGEDERSSEPAIKDDSSDPSSRQAGAQQARKRKYVEAETKSKKISEKLREMKKKQGDAEKWKKQRSILINLTLGASVVAVSSVLIAYFWYGKNA